MSEFRLSQTERAVLKAWESTEVGRGFGFRVAQSRSGVEQHKIRRAVRALARKGALEFAVSLWTEDGDMIGAGYVLTLTGSVFLANEALNEARAS